MTYTDYVFLQDVNLKDNSICQRFDVLERKVDSLAEGQKHIIEMIKKFKITEISKSKMATKKQSNKRVQHKKGITCICKLCLVSCKKNSE